jgi:hypothetical protein
VATRTLEVETRKVVQQNPLRKLMGVDILNPRNQKQAKPIEKVNKIIIHQK